jgi:methylmalonyl-CoA mutase N-terminal domain/subunit
LAAIDSGYFVEEIAASAYEDQRAVETGERRVVGVNCYRDTGERVDIEVFRVDPAIERGQIERLRQLRAQRDSSRVEATLDALESAARTGEPVIEPTIAAVRAYATVGEISDRLRSVYGSHRAGRTV